jgi:ribose 5-phosphate isomerase B
MPGIIETRGYAVPVGTHEDRTIIIAADHRGFDYKSRIVKELESRYDIVDIGTHSTERCDYPPISDKLGRPISRYPCERAGIGICGSGIGILIPASKHRGVYAARCLNPGEAETSRRHNNTNLLGIGADCVKFKTAMETIDAWLTTPFYSDPENEEAYLNRFLQILKLESEALRRKPE